LKKFTLIFLVILLVPAAVAGWVLPEPETIRVALLKGVDSVALDGIGLLAVDERGEPVRESPNYYVTRSKDGNGLLVNGSSMRKLTVTAPVYIKVNGRKYRGAMELFPSDNGILVVNDLPLEDYLTGLINCEISSQWPMEAIKAQAVVARTYAVFQKESHRNSLYDLESTVLDQVYNGCEIEDSRAARGVRETIGEVLTNNNSVIQAFYHSNCGGHTESSENVWGFPFPYLQGVDCSYCLGSQSARWEQTLPLSRIETLLNSAGFNATGLKDIRSGRKNRSGRLVELTLEAAKGRLTISAVNFRKAIGYTIIKSTNFEVRVAGGNALFNGIGYGHGVGLCQWGAKQRAADGFDYREILSYYYPGTRIKKVYSGN
jgi:stage II sporulation protein D